MSLGLTLLLNAAGSALDRLWMQRLGHDTGLLLPDFLDPGHVCAAEAPPGEEGAALRGTLLEIGAQMRAVGLAGLARAVLRAALPERRRAALLALAGAGPWQVVEGAPELRQRRLADGRLCLLASEAAGGASHAPHAMLALRQRLWVLPSGAAPSGGAVPEGEPEAVREEGVDCLSLDIALEEVALALGAEGEAELATQVLALRGQAPAPCLVAPEPPRRQDIAAA